jgi:hypothetical protein
MDGGPTRLGYGHELLDEPRLSDTRVARHDDESGAAEVCAEAIELLFAANERTTRRRRFGGAWLGSGHGGSDSGVPDRGESPRGYSAAVMRVTSGYSTRA